MFHINDRANQIVLQQINQFNQFSHIKIVLIINHYRAMNKQYRINLNQTYRTQVPISPTVEQVIEEINKELKIQTLQSKITQLVKQIRKLKEQNNQLNDAKLSQEQSRQDYAKTIQEEKDKNQQATIRCQSLMKQLQQANLEIEKYKSINAGFDDLKRIMERKNQKKEEFEKSKEQIAQCEEIRTRNEKILQLECKVANCEEKNDDLNASIKELNSKKLKIEKLNQEQRIQIQRLSRQITLLKAQADATKIRMQTQYQQNIRKLEEAGIYKEIQNRQKQAKFIEDLQNKDKQIEVSIQKCSELKNKYNQRIISEGEIIKQKTIIEDENETLKNQIEYLTKKATKYLSKVSEIENEDKKKYEQQLERIKAQNQAKLKDLREQIQAKVNNLTQSSKNTQYLLSQQIKQVKDTYEHQMKQLRGNILSLEEELKKQQADKNSMISRNKEHFQDLMNQKNDLELQFTLTTEIIEQLKEILNKNGRRSTQYKQLPVLLENLLIQKADILQDMHEKYNTIKRQNDQHCCEIAKTQQLIKALRHEFTMIKKFENMVCIRDRRLSDYEITSQIERFIQQIIPVEISNQRQRQKLQIALKDVGSRLSISQHNEKGLCQIKEQLQLQLLQRQKEINILNERIATLIQENSSAVNELKLQIQAQSAKNQSQKQNIRQCRAYIKQIQSALHQKDQQILDLKQTFNQKFNLQANRQQEYIQDLQRDKKRIIQIEQMIEDNVKTINQITNQNRLLEQKLVKIMGQFQTLNQQKQQMAVKFEEQLKVKSQQMNSEFELVIKNMQDSNIQACANHLKRICRALGEVSLSVPSCTSFDDVVRYIKKEFLNSLDTTLSVSPILENKPLERSFLKEQVCRFLQVKTISTTLIYKYDKLSWALNSYLPEIKNNFPYILLMKSEKQMFGVICEGLDKKALPFNLNRRTVYPPQAKAKKSQNYFVGKVLNFGNAEIKLNCSRQRLQVSLCVTIYGDRCYSFSKSDLVGSDEQKESVPLQSIQIHKINI